MDSSGAMPQKAEARCLRRMAGKGPAPKHPHLRARANVPERGDWQVLDREPFKKPPPLPRPYPRGGWSAKAKGAWQRWWASPMAPMWDEGDYELVDILLKMVHDWWEDPTTTQATQMRLTMDTLGLTVKGRQDRHWWLPGEAPLQLEVIDGGRSNVRRLHAVDG